MSEVSKRPRKLNMKRPMSALVKEYIHRLHASGGARAALDSAHTGQASHGPKRKKHL